MEKPKKVLLTVTLDKELFDKIDKQATSESRNRSNMATLILKQYFEAKEDKGNN